jgi:hypothetical protein
MRCAVELDLAPARDGAGVLAVLFAGGLRAGRVIDPDARGHGGDDPAHGEETMARGHGGEHAAAADPVRGLAVADGDLRLELAQRELTRGREQQVRFRVLDGDGALRDFDVTHERRMHLILARRDLTGFQHLHPEMAPDGTWSATATIDEPGSYRLFADFSHAGEATTLASDLGVDGAADLRPLPAPAAAAVTDGGYDVRLDATVSRAGAESELRFAITRDGERIQPQEYLGAGGHLVALREGDLAFLHVHPEEAGGDPAFAATFPTAGRYRLFLQFKDEGRVQTVAFTREVGL